MRVPGRDSALIHRLRPTRSNRSSQPNHIHNGLYSCYSCAYLKSEETLIASLNILFLQAPWEEVSKSCPITFKQIQSWNSLFCRSWCNFPAQAELFFTSVLNPPLSQQDLVQTTCHSAPHWATFDFFFPHLKWMTNDTHRFPLIARAPMCTLLTGSGVPLVPGGCRGYHVSCTYDSLQTIYYACQTFPSDSCCLTSKSEVDHFHGPTPQNIHDSIKKIKKSQGMENSLFIATSCRWAAAWWVFQKRRKKNPFTAHRSWFLCPDIWDEIIKTYWLGSLAANI